MKNLKVSDDTHSEVKLEAVKGSIPIERMTFLLLQHSLADLKSGRLKLETHEPMLVEVK